MLDQTFSSTHLCRPARLPGSFCARFSFNFLFFVSLQQVNSSANNTILSCTRLHTMQSRRCLFPRHDMTKSKTKRQVESHFIRNCRRSYASMKHALIKSDLFSENNHHRVPHIYFTMHKNGNFTCQLLHHWVQLVAEATKEYRRGKIHMGDTVCSSSIPVNQSNVYHRATDIHKYMNRQRAVLYK